MDGTLFQTDKILELSLDDTFDHLRSTNYRIRNTRLKNTVKLWVCRYRKFGKALRHSIVKRTNRCIFLDRLIENIKAERRFISKCKRKYLHIKEIIVSIYIASNGLKKEYLRAIVTYYALDRVGD